MLTNQTFIIRLLAVINLSVYVWRAHVRGLAPGRHSFGYAKKRRSGGKPLVALGSI